MRNIEFDNLDAVKEEQEPVKSDDPPAISGFVTAGSSGDLAGSGKSIFGSEELEISDRLLGARMNANAQYGFPGTPPKDLATAYMVQERSIDRWPDEVAGWKVGGIGSPWREKLGAQWLVGPIFSQSVRERSSDQPVSMPIYRNGFAAIEPELIIRLGTDRNLDQMFIGAEIASSPVPAINDYGPTAVVCDFGNNNGLLVGNEIPDWMNITTSLEVSIWIDGEIVGRRVLDNLSDRALSARVFCIEHAQNQGRTLPPGTLISTGAITGIHEAEIGARCCISFAEFGKLELLLAAADPISEEHERR